MAQQGSKIYKNYLVKTPIPWYAKPKILIADKISKYIVFIKEGEEVNVIYTQIVYNFNDIAKNLNPKVSYLYSRNKTTIELNNTMYRDKYKLQEPNKYRIEKDRYILNGKTVLDVYKDRLIGLAILKCRLDMYYDSPIIMPYLKYTKEITTDNRFSTYNLSSLKSILSLGI